MKTLEATSLYFKSGSSDKVYHAQIQETEGGCVVNFQYGRRGSTLTTGTKTPSPVPKADADKIYQKLVKEKTGKGYTPAETGEVFSSEEFKAKKTDLCLQLSNPIEEEEVEKYLLDDDYFAQEKYDGQRRAVDNDKSPVGINRKGLEVQLPEVVAKSILEKGIFDAEIIGDKLYVFDVISLGGKDLKKTAASERVKLLEKVKFGKAVEVVSTAYTTKEKRELLEKVKANKGEGVIFKKKTSVYTGGRPNSYGDHVKHKLYKTATFLVDSITKGKRSVGLVLLNEKGLEVKVGKTTIPSNFDIPEVGDLVEVRYLYAYEGGAVYQPVYLGKRDDLEKSAAVLSQLVYKPKTDEDEE